MQDQLSSHSTLFHSNAPIPYDSSLVLPTIKEYLNCNKTFTAKLLQETCETDVEVLAATLASYAEKNKYAIEKLGAFLRNKDFLPNEYPVLKAEREANVAKENQMPLAPSFTSRQ